MMNTGKQVTGEQINLLLPVFKVKNKHYCLIRNLSRLVSNQISNHVLYIKNIFVGDFFILTQNKNIKTTIIIVLLTKEFKYKSLKLMN